MTSRLTPWTLDVHDVDLTARFGARALDYRVETETNGSAHLYPSGEAAAGSMTVWLRVSAAPKRDKNRNHPDLVAVDADVNAEVARLVELGARHIDIEQTPDDAFVVLADPKGNEFFVLRRTPQYG